MERYSSLVEKAFRNAFGFKKSKSINWLKVNVSLAKRYFGEQRRWAIAIDTTYISKAGKKAPHIGRFWSGCTQAVKHGLKTAMLVLWTARLAISGNSIFSQCFVHITKCCQSNYEGDGNGIFYVSIQVTDDQHLFGETNFQSKWVHPEPNFN